MTRTLPLGQDAPYRRLVGVGGIGSGIFFALEGDHALGRNESRAGRLLDVRDYCKLHIVAHYPAVLLGARPEGRPFHVLPLGMIGEDESGRRLLAEMGAAGMDGRLVQAVPGHPTLLSVCFQYPDGSGGNVTTSNSAAAQLAPADVERARPWLDRQTIALALPEAPLAARLRLLALATEHGALRVASFATAELAEVGDSGLLAQVDLLALNEDEAAALAGAPFAPEDAFLERCARAARAVQPALRLVVTAGACGAFACQGSGFKHVPALPLPVASTAGAGDALLGGALAGLATGLPFHEAVQLGSLAAAFKLSSAHTIPPGLSTRALATLARERRVPLGDALAAALPGA